MARIKQSDVEGILELLEAIDTRLLAQSRYNSGLQSKIAELTDKLDNLSAIYSEENRKRIDLMFHQFVDELYETRIGAKEDE